MKHIKINKIYKMKYIKNFENLDEPKIGDYIVAKPFNLDNLPANIIDILLYVSNNIGQLINITKTRENKYIVKYNIPQEIYLEGSDKFNFTIEDILYYSSNKKDVEIFLAAKKYNI